MMLLEKDIIMYKKATLSLAAAITLLAPIAATAQTEEATSITVNVDDLNLSSPKDQARMYNRIKDRSSHHLWKSW